MPPRVPSDFRTLAGTRPHDTVGADDVRNLRSAGAFTSGNKGSRSAAGWRCLTANRHFIIVVRKASDPYAGAIVDG